MDYRTCRCGAKVDFEDTIGLVAHVMSAEHEAVVSKLPPLPIDAMRSALVGLRVIGKAEDGWLVRHRLTDRKLQPLEDQGFRLTPSGPKHTIVRLPREVV